MNTEVRHEDGVAVIMLDNPPVNGLGLATRQAVWDAVERAEADGAVSCIVLAGAGKLFSAGADIREFGTPTAYREPNLLSLIERVETCKKPVVAALHGTCVGGGLELAMGCHYRVAAPGCQIGLPEVKLGLLPGAGGTQRLPRALGVEVALNMVVSGEFMRSERIAGLAGQRLIDQMATSESALLTEARAFAQSVAQARPMPRLRDLDCQHPQGDGFFAFARNSVKQAMPKYPAALACVNAIESATRLSFEQGMAKEREIFLGLMDTPECKSLRHLFLAERNAAKVPGVAPDTPERAVKRVAVVGAGTMGSGIAMNFLNIGLPVALIDNTTETLARGVASIQKNYQAQVSKGKLTEERLAQRMGLLEATLSLEPLSQADLIIEAVFEDLLVKKEVFGRIDAMAKPGAILASNTSTLDLNVIAAATARPADVVGLHFFSPANVMRLLEVVRGEKTAPDVMATVMKLGKRIKKTPVVSGVCDGFIGNRMIEQYIRQAGFLLEEGCTPRQVDQAIEKFGFAMGPFRMSDLAGNDIGWAIRKRRYVEKPQIRYSPIADALCEMGRFGQKTSAGWYDYQAGRREAIESAVVGQMIAKYRTDHQITLRQVSEDEIVHRLVFALVNEGALLLEEGIAARAGDIDVVYLMGYGFPPWRGGPMHYADSYGLDRVVHAMKRFAQNPMDDATFWQPAPLLRQLAQQGGSFTGGVTP